MPLLGKRTSTRNRMTEKSYNSNYCSRNKKSLMMSKSVKCKMITLLRLHNSFRFHMTCFTFLFSIFKSWNHSFINFSHHSHRTWYTSSFSASKHIELNDKPMLNKFTCDLKKSEIHMLLYELNSQITTTHFSFGWILNSDEFWIF